jgi:hypothetical protein
MAFSKPQAGSLLQVEDQKLNPELWVTDAANLSCSIHIMILLTEPPLFLLENNFLFSSLSLLS